MQHPCRLPHWMIIIALFVLITPKFLQAQQSSTDYVISNLSLQNTDTEERLIIEFSETYPELPIIDFDEGLLYIFLKSTKLQTTQRSFAALAGSRVFRQIRATENTNSTLIEVILQSSQWSLENQVQLQQNGTLLTIGVNPDALPAPVASSNVAQQGLTTEIEQRLAQGEFLAIPPPTESANTEEANTEANSNPQDAVIPGLAYQEDSWMMNLAMVLLCLFLLLSTLFVVLYAYNRFLAARFPGRHEDLQIQVVSQFHVGPKQKIQVLKVQDEYLACGVTPSHVTFLTKLKTPEATDFLSQVQVRNGEIQLDQDQVKADFLKTLEAARQQAGVLNQGQANKPTAPSQTTETTDTAEATETATPREHSIENFTEALNKKLKLLKPIN